MGAEQEAEADAETEAPIQPQEADEQAEEAAVPEKFDAARSQLKTQLDMSMLRTTTSRQSAEAARSVLRSMITEEGEAQPQDGAQEAAPEADEVRASAPVGLPGVTYNSPPHQKQKTEHKHKKTVADGPLSFARLPGCCGGPYRGRAGGHTGRACARTGILIKHNHQPQACDRQKESSPHTCHGVRAPLPSPNAQRGLDWPRRLTPA